MGIVTRLAAARQTFRSSRGRSVQEQTMSSTNNGTITLKSFADLAQHLDLESLPPGPPDVDETTTNSVESIPADGDGPPALTSIGPALLPVPPVAPAQDLAGLIAQLAGVTSSLEAA